jgi:hypothetical protein
VVGVDHDLLVAYPGFLWEGGTVTPITIPDRGSTFPFGINDLGDIMGQYCHTDGKFYGFLLADGVFTIIDIPGAQAVVTRDVNQSGMVVGDYLDDAGQRRGFFWHAGMVTLMDVPDSFLTKVTGIDDVPQIVGQWHDGITLDSVDVSESTETLPIDINNNSQISGSFRHADGLSHGFLVIAR